MTIEEKARAGYEKYGDFVGWRNYAGLAMPKWDELPGKIREAWAVAAQEISTLTAEECVPRAPRG